MLRCEQLARLLRETDLPIEAAMRKLGWSSRGHRALRDRGSQGGPQVGELASRGRREDDAVLMHAGHDGVETTWDASHALLPRLRIVGTHLLGSHRRGSSGVRG